MRDVSDMLPEALKENMSDDPFGTTAFIIKGALELGLDDGVSGKMSDDEYAILEKIAVIITQEAGLSVEPRPA
jgi:hypothetical protein